MAIQALKRLQATARTKQVADVDPKAAARIIEQAFAAEGIRVKAKPDMEDGGTYIFCEGRADGMVKEPFDFSVFLDGKGKSARILFDFLNMPGMNNNLDFYTEDILPDTLKAKKKVNTDEASRGMEKFIGQLNKVTERAKGMAEFAKRFAKAMARLQKLMEKNAK